MHELTSCLYYECQWMTIIEHNDDILEFLDDNYIAY